MPILRLKIESILGGQAPTQYLAAKDEFNSSIAIDPDFSISSTDIKTSAYAVPTAYAKFSGANVNAAPIAIVNDPKDTKTYVVLSNGRLISYDSSFGSETLIGTVTGNVANGAWYYNNYIWISTDTDLSRYGPLNGTPAIINTSWTGAGPFTGTSGGLALTALTNTSYPSLRNVTLPNHWGFVHGDGTCYITDFINGQGMLHRLQTKRTTVEGDTAGTSNPSAYQVLTLPFGYYPAMACSYSTDVAIIAFQTTNTTIDQGSAALFLWDPTNTVGFYRGPIPLSDPLATAILNVNGLLYLFTGNASNGMRVSRYIGGDSVRELVYQEEGTPPFQGAVASRGTRIVWGGWTTYPINSASVFAINSKEEKLSSDRSPLQNVVKSSSAGTNGVITALRFSQQSSNIQPKVIVASNDGSGSQIDNFSASGTLSSVIRWLFALGRHFRILRFRTPFAGSVDANTSITPKFYIDDASSSTALSVINNTNFPSKRKALYKQPQLVGVEGENNFMLEYTWGSTTALPLGFPIELDVDVDSDEPD